MISACCAILGVCVLLGGAGNLAAIVLTLNRAKKPMKCALYINLYLLNSRFYLPLDWYFSDVLDDYFGTDPLVSNQYEPIDLKMALE